MAGTPQYMVAETLEACCANLAHTSVHSLFSLAAEDWWSMGATLYEAAIGLPLVPLPQTYGGTDSHKQEAPYAVDMVEAVLQIHQDMPVVHLGPCCLTSDASCTIEDV